MMWGYTYGYPMMGYGGWGVMSVVSSIFWSVILIVMIVFIIRWIRGGRMPMHHRNFFDRNSALDILKERYAKGEIDKAEFEEKKRDLSA